MPECTDKTLGNMIHAYELGILNEQDSNAFEIHLLECPYCNEKFRELNETVRVLKSDTDIKSSMRQLASQTIDQLETVAESSSPRPFYRRPTPIKVITTIAAVLVLLLLKPWQIRFESDNPANATENKVAIMPFESLAPKTDSTRIADIVTNLLIADLSESHYLKVITGENVLNSSEYLRLRDSSIDSVAGEQAALEQYGVRWTLVGHIIQTDPEIVISARLTDQTDQQVVASLQLNEQENEDIFQLVDRLAAQVRQELLSPHALQDEFDPRLADVTTTSAEAFRWYLEGVELYGRKHFNEAAACYRKSVQYDSTFAFGWYCLAFHDVPNALENAVRFSKRASHREQLYINSLVAQRAGDDQKAEQLLRELVDKYPNEKIAWMELASIARQQRRFSDAAYDLKQSLKADPLYIDAINLLAYVYNDMGDFDNALVTINESIVIEPNEPNPYDSKGELLAMNGNLDEAVTHYELALAKQPDFMGYETALRLGQLYIYQGRYHEARETLLTALSKGAASTRSSARVALAFIPLYQGKLAQAGNILNDAFAAERLEQTEQSNPGVLLHMYLIKSRIELARHDTTAARETLREGTLLMQKTSAEYLNYYTAYFAYGLSLVGDSVAVEQLIDELRNRLGEDGHSLDPVYRAQGFVAFAYGQYGRALELLKKITEPTLINFDSRYLQARANLELGQTDEAVRLLKESLRDFVDRARLRNSLAAVDAYYYLGLAEEYLGEKEKASEHYAKLLTIWAEADPSVTLIPDARQRLSRLKGNL